MAKVAPKVSKGPLVHVESLDHLAILVKMANREKKVSEVQLVFLEDLVKLAQRVSLVLLVQVVEKVTRVCEEKQVQLERMVHEDRKVNWELLGDLEDTDHLV